MLNKISCDFRSKNDVVTQLAKQYDVRGLDFTESGFHIIFYRQLPDNFENALREAGLRVSEFCYPDDDRGDQYLYSFAA
jgi:hypothetical protein